MSIHDIPFQNEFTFKTSRSSGKGGQHVNKTESKVELNFNVAESQLLNEEQKALITERLGKRINNDGVLQITAEKERSQYLNKQITIDKFYDLLEKALKKKKVRKAVKMGKAAKEKLKHKKKELSEKKKSRRENKVL